MPNGKGWFPEGIGSFRAGFRPTLGPLQDNGER